MFKLFLILLVTIFSNANAILAFEDAVAPELITSARALAMGNAYICKVDDSWSAFYNPAGLGTVRKPMVHFGNVHIETNNGFLDITGGGGNYFDAISSYSSAFDPEGLRDLHRDTPGRISHARVNLFPNITFRGFTLGYLYSKQNRARYKSTLDSFEVAERTDSGPVLAFNLSLWGGIFKIGASAALLKREQLQKDFEDIENVSVSRSLDYTSGQMTYTTIGARLTLPVFMLPTFAAVLRNSSGQNWFNEDLSGTPDRVPQTLDVGFSLEPITNRNIRVHMEVNYKDLSNQFIDIPRRRKLLAGLEVGLRRAYFFRLGLGDGWGSGGIGVRSKRFIFDLTTYAIEGDKSSGAFRSQEDRRYIISMSSGF